MAHYGHSLQFGVEITPSAQAPNDAVAVAAVADSGGLDLILVRGGAEGGSDASTLAGWIAARTTNLQVATQVDPTLRPASVVAREIGSLQLLTGGRSSLVLRADDTPGDSTLVEESVAVIRAMQDTAHDRVTTRGIHHHVAGAEPGPIVDHEVPLWVYGSTTASAALAGRLADGWLVDFDDLGFAALAELNAVVDRSANSAGRDVREIRRALTLAGPGAVDVSELIALVVDHGVSSVLVRATIEDEAELRSFLEDVVPQIREGAERALPPGALSSPPVRRADIRAQRRPGIGYDEIPQELATRAVEPGDAAFAKVRSTYLRGGNPGLVLRPQDATEVVSAVEFARKHTHVPLGIRSGGHGISGRSTNDGGLVIDVGALNQITVVDTAARRVRIGAGARWRDVATALEPHGWALTSGDYGGVGVGGLATAGGIGFLSRKHGLTIDHLDAVEMVLADGSLVRASTTENPDLFWAIRGAGANFGIAVAFEFTVVDVAQVGWAQLAFQAPDPAAYLEAFGQVAMNTPRETTPFLILGRGVAQMMAMVDSADPEVIVEQLQPFAEIAPLVQQQVVVAPYAAVMNMFPDAPHVGRGEPVSRSAFADQITPGFAAASAELLASGAPHWYQIRTVGGAVADVAPHETAYAHRSANFSLTVMGSNAQRVDRWFDPIREHSSGLYLSFESDTRPDRLSEAFPPATLNRLRQIKEQVDPNNLFRDNFNLIPTHHVPGSSS